MFKLKDNPIHPDYYKYPSSDGEPMAETTLHLRWLITIKENLEILTQGKDIFVAGDLLWYPVKGKVNICKAPDVMVAVGRPKGDRLSYLQWHEGNVSPQVVFEVFSKSNRRRLNKENLLEFYEKYGVEEYYSYDPVRNVFVIHLWQDNKFTRLEGLQKWVSPLLNIRFEWNETSFEIYRPDGSSFVNFEELERQNRYLAMQYKEVLALRLQEHKWLVHVEEDAKLARQEAEAEKQKAEAEKQKAEAEKQKAEAEKQKAEAAVNRQKILEDKLRKLGIDPKAI